MKNYAIAHKTPIQFQIEKEFFRESISYLVNLFNLFVMSRAKTGHMTTALYI